MTTFQEFNLDIEINKAIKACGYTHPTPVQAQSIPKVLQGNDVVVSAQTGTGKTAAFVLPALHKLSLQKPNKKTRVLILTPTRELASQITKASSLYGKFLRFNIVSLVGGMPYHNQIKDLARGADIIVATPGRLLDHIDQKRIDLSHVEMLILDEADRMLDMGFIEDVQYIAKLTPEKRQTLLFSATLDNKLMNAVRHLLKNPARIDLSVETISAPTIKQELYKVNSPHQKTRLLKHFLADENIYKAIIFSATKIMADKLANQLREEGFSAAPLHGDLRQNVRNRTLEQLRRGKIQFLVATDVAARGIDVSDITHVFNYDLPRFCEDYVHRIGRTGRAGKTGVAISFVLPSDSKNVKSIERFIGKRINLINFDMDKISQQRIAQTEPNDNPIEILTLKKEVNLKDKSERNFRDKNKQNHEGKPRRHFAAEKENNFGKKRERSFGEKKARRFDEKRRPAVSDDNEHHFSEKSQRGSRDKKNNTFEGKRERGFSKRERSFNDSKDHSFSEKGERGFRGHKERHFGKKRDAGFGNNEERSFGDKRERDFGDKKERSYGKKREGGFSNNKERSFGDKRERDFGDKKERSYGKKREGGFSNNKERSFGDKRERDFGDKNERSYGKKREGGFSKNKERSFSGKKDRGYGDKNERGFDKKRERSFNENTDRGFTKKNERSFGEERFASQRKSKNNPFDGTRKKSGKFEKRS